jgi:hypothetical protein
LQPFGIFYDHLVKFVVIWYIVPRFGMVSGESPNVGSPNGVSPKTQMQRFAESPVPQTMFC